MSEISYPQDLDVVAEQTAFYALPLSFDKFMPISSLRESRKDLGLSLEQWNAFAPQSLLSLDSVCLKLERTVHAKPELSYVPSYFFSVHHKQQDLGEIDLRIGYTEKTYYGGNIGCHWSTDVEKQYMISILVRACRLLIPLAKYHGMTCLCLSTDARQGELLTVCQYLGADFRRCVALPPSSDLYQSGRVYSNICFWQIAEPKQASSP